MTRIAADASVFHAIADPTRRRVLELLRDGEQAVSALLTSLGGGAGLRARRRPAGTPAPPSQSALSQHLAVLRSAGLVAVRKAGRQRIYRVRPAPLREVAAWIGYFDKFWDQKLENLGRYLDEH